MGQIDSEVKKKGISVLSLLGAVVIMGFFAKMMGKGGMVAEEDAMPGRKEKIGAGKHAIFGTDMDGEFPGMEKIVVGMGCFWGAERKFWTKSGVVSTAVGYGQGYSPNPTYYDVCSGQTGHSEVVRVVFDPKQTNLESILSTFWESHNPTQGMRQGNDVGSQYRSGVYYYNDKQKDIIERSKQMYQKKLEQKGYGTITTEVLPAKTFYFAEDYHQQYLHKNPRGYCGLGGTGVSCPVSLIQSEN